MATKLNKAQLAVVASASYVKIAAMMVQHVGTMPDYANQDGINATFAYLDGLQRFVDDMHKYMIDKGMVRSNVQV